MVFASARNAFYITIKSGSSWGCRNLRFHYIYIQSGKPGKANIRHLTFGHAGPS